MFGIFNRVIRTSTRTDTWNAPDHWQGYVHQSTFHRQQMEAERHLKRLRRDVGMF